MKQYERLEQRISDRVAELDNSELEQKRQELMRQLDELEKSEEYQAEEAEIKNLYRLERALKKTDKRKSFVEDKELVNEIMEATKA
jgi:hypothetical protein